MAVEPEGIEIPPEETLVDPVPDTKPVPKGVGKSVEPLIDLESAIGKIPEALRKEMKELLGADFSEVIRLKP